MINHWLSQRNRKNTIREINGLLLKFIGRKIDPIQIIYQDMQHTLINFLKNNPKKLDFLTNDVKNFKYRFEIKDQGGFITEVSFEI